MDKIDRFIRVIYKDADLRELCIWPDNSAIQEEILSNQFLLPVLTQIGAAEFSDDRFFQNVIHDYLLDYHSEQNEDEAQLLLSDIIRKVREKYSLSSDIILNSCLFLAYSADETLRYRNGKLFSKEDSLLEWNGLMNKADFNGYIGAFVATHAIPGFRGFDSVKYDDKVLDAVLREGYCENHMHLNGSGYTAEMNWHYFISGYDSRRKECLNSLAKIIDTNWGNPDQSKRERISLSFQKIPMIRKLLILSSFFSKKHDASNQQKTEIIIRNIFKALDDLSLLQIERGADYEDVAAFYNEAIDTLFGNGHADRFEPTVLDEPLDYYYEEQVFMSLMFRQMLDSELSQLAAYAFNTYIAAVTQFKFALMQDNFVMGFRKFKKSENIKEVFIDSDKNGKLALYKTVFRKYYIGCNVKKVEFRIGPKKKGSLIKLIRMLDMANKDAYEDPHTPIPEMIDFGLVVHFIKDGKPECIKSGLSRKEELAIATQAKYNELKKFFELDDKSRAYLNKVIGIDAANFEIGTRPEVYGPIFRRYASEVLSCHNGGVTYHAGEDFITLCNGLRAIDEAIEFLELGVGDRVGHATALGLDIHNYYKRKRFYVLTSLQEYIDDIVWLYDQVKIVDPDRADLLIYLNDEYEKYALKLFGPLSGNEQAGINASTTTTATIPTMTAYRLAYKLRGDDPSIYIEPNDKKDAEAWRTTKESKAIGNIKEVRDLYKMYQFDGEYKIRGTEQLVINVDDLYMEAVGIAQKSVRAKIVRKGISIEANPSSNRKISYVDRYIDLHILRLNQHRLTLPDGFCPSTEGLDITITINTDDSGIFQTNLDLEYAYIVEAMKREKFSHAEIYDYIDYLRSLSCVQSFVPDKPKKNADSDSVISGIDQ